jgi:hypothetical protein
MRVAGASGVDVEVLEFSGEQFLHRGVLKRRGARPVPLSVGLDLREGPLDLLCSGSPVSPMPLVSFFAVSALLPFSFSAGAWVDVELLFRKRTSLLKKAVSDRSRAQNRIKTLGNQG